MCELLRWPLSSRVPKKKKSEKEKEKKERNEAKEKKACPVREKRWSSWKRNVSLLKCECNGAPMLRFRSLRRRCSRQASDRVRPCATLRISLNPVRSSIVQELRLLPIDFFLVYLAVSEFISLSLCVLADKCAVTVSSHVNQQENVKQQEAAKPCQIGKIVCFLHSKMLPFKKFSALRPKPRWGAQRPSDPYLQSTSIHCWLRPCMCESMLVIIVIINWYVDGKVYADSPPLSAEPKLHPPYGHKQLTQGLVRLRGRFLVLVQVRFHFRFRVGHVRSPVSVNAAAGRPRRAWVVVRCGCCSIRAGMAVLGCEREESTSLLSAKFSSCRSARRMASDFRCASSRAVIMVMSCTWPRCMSCSCRSEDSSSSRRWRRRRIDAADLVVSWLAREPISQWVGSYRVDGREHECSAEC